MIDFRLANAIQPGVDNKASVEKLLGPPDIRRSVRPNEWYYMSRDTTQVAFRNPRRAADHGAHPLRRRRQRRLDAAGRARNVISFDPDCRDADPRPQASFFEELFGNIGTVSHPGANSTAQNRSAEARFRAAALS